MRGTWRELDVVAHEVIAVFAVAAIMKVVAQEGIVVRVMVQVLVAVMPMVVAVVEVVVVCRHNEAVLGADRWLAGIALADAGLASAGGEVGGGQRRS